MLQNIETIHQSPPFQPDIALIAFSPLVHILESDLPFHFHIGPALSIMLSINLQTRLLLLVVLSLSVPLARMAGAPLVLVGAAKTDITPDLPIRLTGYTGRPAETDQIERRLYARALAIGADRQSPAVLITVEVIGISRDIADAVAASLKAKHGIERERVSVCSTHVHSGPAIRGVLPFMFAKDLPAAELSRIDRYTDTLVDKLVNVAVAALEDRRPGSLGWAEGRVGFATQRRRIADGKWIGGGGADFEGHADRVLPLMRVTDDKGVVRALFTSYACHCTSIGGAENFIHSDWAGEASAEIETTHDGAVALIALGCGADANPYPRGSIDTAIQHGKSVAAEVGRLLQQPFRPLDRVTIARYRQIELAFDHPITREELQDRIRTSTKRPRIYAASKFIQEIDSGGGPPAGVPYPVQTWIFGDALAMVFLGGEVVSEYALRLRREFDADRLWVNAYANDVACYIPSKRMFAEGGYEVDSSMDFYGLPSRLSIQTEDRVIDTVHSLIPSNFYRPIKN